MNIKSLSLALLFVPALAPSCSGGDGGNSATYDVTADVSVPVNEPVESKKAPEGAQACDNACQSFSSKDVDVSSEPYRLGREHATRLHVQCKTESEVRDELLDVNARIYAIRCRIGEDAANDYVQGFKAYLKEVGDTLASVMPG